MNTILGLDETVESLRHRVNQDKEFRLKARKWEGRFKLVYGDDVFVFQMHEGELERIEADTTLFTAADFVVEARKDEWDRLLEREPEPFYQDLYAAWLHHGFRVEGDLEQFFGFHMALRRLQQILRGIE